MFCAALFNMITIFLTFNGHKKGEKLRGKKFVQFAFNSFPVQCEVNAWENAAFKKVPHSLHIGSKPPGLASLNSVFFST